MQSKDTTMQHIVLPPCTVPRFPSMGVRPPPLPLRLGPPVLGRHAGGHAVPHVVKQARAHTHCWGP